MKNIENHTFFEENSRFSRLIAYYARKLKTADASCDLWSFLWLLRAANDRPLSDRYVAVSLRNEYIRLSKEKSRTVELLHDYAAGDSGDLDLRLDLSEALLYLTEKERQVLILTTLCGYSSAEIARCVGISRQAVNQTRKRACKKLRKSLGLTSRN